MPEAAEVTVAAVQLHRVAAGRVLTGLDVSHDRTTRAQPAAALDVFVGAPVRTIDRYGKWIVIHFEGLDPRLGIHLRMSGQLLARRPGDRPADRHVHARLSFSDRGPKVGAPQVGAPQVDAPMSGVPDAPGGAAGTSEAPVEVWFRDPRTFGELRILGATPPVAPDLFDPAVTPARLVDGASRRRVGVKAVLLDQLRTMSGVGSYLADEALHRAGISPRRPADRIHFSAWERILDACREITVASAAAGGVTLPDEGWVDLWGRPGRYGPELRVHGRTACAACGTPTRSAVVGGRSARWCPRCQDARRVR